ncbi:MAG: dipeptidase [Planctomycetes bacterium]|nr:dipeptidase [Planctomycetota bacterium]
MRTYPLILSLLLCGCAVPLEDRAREIHERVLTLDTHKDIDDALATRCSSSDPSEIEAYRRRADPTFDGSNQVDFPKARRGHYDCAFFIVYVDQTDDLSPRGFRAAKRAADLKFRAIERMCGRFPEYVELARTPDDVRRIHASGKLVCCIGIENGSPMGDDLGNIREFWERGARYMSITHNDHNQLGDSHTPPEPLHGGLTELGRAAVAEMNRVGIMVDISHASKQTALDVIECSRAPVIASHSGARAICDHTRNLDDETLRALAENGGVVQCVALDDFVKDQRARNAEFQKLADDLGMRSQWGLRGAYANGDLDSEAHARYRQILAHYPAANVSDFVDHIDHVVKTIGIDHVAIASDFDGGGGIDGWNRADETFNVTLELVRRGYTEDEIAKIWSGNTLRLWSEVETVAHTIQ